jgi:hypothetical protein
LSALGSILKVVEHLTIESAPQRTRRRFKMN